MPPRLRRRCVYITRGGRPCGKEAFGNPPLCEKHGNEIAEEEDDLLGDAMNHLLEHPDVQQVVRRAGGFIDQLGEFVSSGFRFPSRNGSTPHPPPQNGHGHNGHTPPRPPPRADVKILQARIVLGFEKDEPLDRAKVKARQRALSQALHPDKQGGSTKAMARVNQAADVLLKECR